MKLTFIRPLALALVVSSGALLSSCGSDVATEALLKRVEQAKASCPEDVSGIGSLTDVAFNQSSKCVTFTYDVDTSYVDPGMLKAGSEYLKNIILLDARVGDRRKMADDIVGAGASAQYIFNSPDKTDDFSIELSDAEIKDALNHPKAESELCRDMLENRLAIESKRYPEEIEKGVSVAGSRIVGDDVVYSLIVDNSGMKASALRANYKNAKNVMREALSQPGSRQLAELMAGCDMGLIYRYYFSNNRDSVDLTFSRTEIAHIAR